MKIVLCITVWTLAAAGFVGAADTTPAPLPPIEEAVGEVVKVLQRYSLPFDAAAAQQAAIDAVVKAADPFGHVVSAEDVERMKEEQRGRVYEVAIKVSVSNKLVTLTDVVQGTPAAEAGLRAGEIVEEIDKGGAAELRLWEIQELLRGPAEESVKFKVQDTNGVAREVDVKRSPVDVGAIQQAEELGMNLCYLKLNGVFAGCGKDIVSTLRGWSASSRAGVVIDLRGAGGGDATSAADVASLFATPGTMLFSFRDGQDQDLNVHKATPGTLLNVPAMILVDERTTGAAEVLAAALAGSARGVMLIGVTTHADPMIRDTVALPNGKQVYLVTRRLVAADGTSYNGHEGVKPDLVVDSASAASEEYEAEPTPGAKKEISAEEKEAKKMRERTGGDIGLRRAVDVLLGLKALNMRGGVLSESPTH